jgi:hypothetical protein
MTKPSAVASLLFLIACAPSESTPPPMAKEPISVRGWIADVEGSTPAQIQTPETEAMRRLQLFQGTNVWVENAPYVSGGVAENGSFLLLDVPPGNPTIVFSAPGAPAAKLVLQNIPGNADVLVPALLLRRDSVALLDPKGVKVRLAEKIERATPTGAIARVGGLTVPVMKTPINAMADRHDYPTPPTGTRPLATYK